MSIRVADRVDGWEQRPFDGGFDALQDLADEAFSGVVRAGGAEAFLTMGTVVAVRHGSIDDFESTTGTVFSAPDPALPLLAVMQAADADVRAQYYSEETPISEVDGTLSSGGFTGFVELSENVLSGDYFLVYHGGESMSVAFVGNNDKLLTEDEAFQTADDEVGIYKVRQVDVDPVEIPEPAEPAAEAAEATAAAATAESASEGEPVAASDDAGSEGAETASTDHEDAATSDAEPAAEAESATEAADAAGDEVPSEDADASTEAAAAERDATTSSTTAETAGASEQPSSETSDPIDAETSEPTDAGTGEPTDAETSEPTDAETGEPTDAETVEETTATSAEPASARPADSAARSTEPAEPERADPGRAPGGESGGHEAGRSRAADATGNAAGGSRGGKTRGRANTAQSAGSRGGSSGAATDLETRSIPSLDPKHTRAPERTTAPDPEPTPRPPQGSSGQQVSGRTEPPRQEPEPQPEPAQPQQTDAAPESDPAQGDSASQEALADLESDLADREEEIERLEADLAAAESDREDLEADLEAVREERDELAAEVERLESELARLEEEFGAATDAENRMTPSEAIEATNLFVEYDTKGNATLADAHEGTEGREAVAENLRLGVHTEFDDRAVVVGGQAFDEFLRNTLHYRFAEWVIGDLLFEVRDTGNADVLPDLYDAIREIRRVEFNGVVDVEYTEDGQHKSGRERFDVIFRHRMGDPLLVANLNDSREPATGTMMTSLVTSAERVGQTEDGLASAFLVTSSFFESEALETVSEATQGGLLSRDSRRSFVNLSRKEGYHLCLVAARDGNFHMEVPEL